MLSAKTNASTRMLPMTEYSRNLVATRMGFYRYPILTNGENMSLNIVLYQPLMPANTGNIARTCAATNTTLHLIKPLGFSTDDKQLKRAGLDYWDKVNIIYHESIEDFFEANQDKKFFYITKFADQSYDEPNYKNLKEEIFFIFGKETTGLPDELLEANPERGLRLPMNDEHVRSLNLSNAAAIVIYEALKQQGFPNLT